MSESVLTLAAQLKLAGIKADKKLGQHFLLDSNVTDKIVRLAGNLSHLNIIEIGPGPGGLTRSLIAAKPASLALIEKDERFTALLQQYQPAATLHSADALKLSPSAIAPTPRAIIANLPYNIGTLLLVNWLREIYADAQSYDFIMVMLQKEVADRIAAEPDSKHYGRLSVLSQWLCRTETLYDIPPSAFSPPPKVDSTVIRLTPYSQDKRRAASWEKVENLTRAAFGQRRKMLRQSIKSLHTNPEEWLESCNISPTSRAENVPVEGFLDLVNV